MCNLEPIMLAFRFDRIVCLLYDHLSRVGLSCFVNCICLNCDSLLSSSYVTYVFLKSCDHYFCIYDAFEVLELIGIVFKVIFFLHEVLCSSFHIVQTSNVIKLCYAPTWSKCFGTFICVEV